MKKTSSLLLGILLLASMILAACGGTSSGGTSSGGTGSGGSGKKLVVAIDATYPPMESEGKDGKPEGFDVDFAKELAKRLGREAEFKVVKWEGIIPGLKAKDYDVIISSMNITEERKKEVDFVEYIQMSQVFVGKKGTSVKTAKDLEGKVVAVQADTTSHEWVKGEQQKGVKVKEIKAFGGATDAFAAVKAGQADVIVIDEPVGKYYAKQDANTFAVTGLAMAAEPVGIAIRKEDSALKGEIQKAVDAMKKDGFIKKLSEQWFGSELGK